MNQAINHVNDMGGQAVGSGQGPRSVLIVDDSMFIRNRLRQALTDAGWEVDEAANGAQGLEKWAAGGYSCIVTDLVMPVMDGFGLLEGLREQHCEVPVVVLTADIQKTTRERCQELGAKEFLNKPVNAEELQAVVNRLVLV